MIGIPIEELQETIQKFKIDKVPGHNQIHGRRRETIPIEYI